MRQVAPETSATLALGSLKVVSFMVGGYRFAVEAAQVRTQFPAGRSDVFFTAEQLLGLPGEKTQILSSRRILLMKHPAGDYSVSVSEPVELHTFGINDIYPLPPLIAACSSLAGVRGLALGAEGITLLVDFRAAKVSVKPGLT